MTNDLACGYISNTDSGLGERSENDRRFDSILRDQNFSRGASIRILRLPQVMQQTGLKKTKLYELQAGVAPVLWTVHIHKERINL